MEEIHLIPVLKIKRKQIIAPITTLLNNIKMRNKILLFFAITISMYSSAQVGIGTSNPDATAVFEIQSTSKGLLIPRLSKIQRDAINSPAVGLLLYQTDNNPGFYYYNASNTWIRIGEETIITTNTASITSNLGVIGSNTISITSNQGAITSNTASITSNINNIVLKAPLASPNFTGIINSAGINISGTVTATAFVGDGSGLSNMNFLVGNNNTKVGRNTLNDLTTGHSNSAFGVDALKSNTTGENNVAFGLFSLLKNTSGYQNVAIGSKSLSENLDGNKNVGSGLYSLGKNTSGNENTGYGHTSLYNNTTGSYNTTIGSRADVLSGALTNATAIGANAVVDASNKIQLGDNNVTLIQTSGTVSATAFVGDGSRLTGINLNAENAQINNINSLGFDIIKSKEVTTGVNLTSDEYNKSYIIVIKNTSGSSITVLTSGFSNYNLSSGSTALFINMGGASFSFISSF